MFSDIWNGIVKELREGDLISNAERDNMLFVHLVIDPSIKPVEGMRPFMLPIFFYGGKVKGALESGSSIDASQRVALKEIRALLVWLLLQQSLATAGKTADRRERTSVAQKAADPPATQRQCQRRERS